MGKSNKRSIFFFLFLTILFSLFVLYRELQFNSQTTSDLKNQSETVSVNLWQFDAEACLLNLNFFSNLDNYTSLEVTDYTGASFCKAEPFTMRKADSLLNKIGLIQPKSFSEPIIYNGKEIGEVHAVKLNKEFYTYLYVFILFLLIALVYLALNSLNRTNSNLNELVAEKTRLLKSSEEELRVTLNSIADGVFAVDSQSKLIQVNPAAEKILGFAGKRSEGKNILDIIIPNEHDNNNPLLSLKMNDISSITTLIGTVVVHGKIKTLNITASPLLDEHNKQIGVVFIISDISEKLELEEQIRHSQKMESIGQLAGGIAHDFNNMLGGIIGPADLLLTEVSDDHKQLVNIIKQSGENAADLTRKLLAFSRKGVVERIPLDIHTPITSAVSILKHSISKKIAVETVLEAESSTVTGDINQLQNVFLNLGINASHAVQDAGKITFSTRETTLDSDFCHNSEFNITPGNYLEISVEDNGSGIEKEHLARIFEPFFTTKGHKKGTGLGLAACHGTIFEHHGAISVTSDISEGTCFTIYLPIAKQKRMNNIQSKPAIHVGKGCVLVVDDEEIIRKTAGHMLKRLGYSVLFAVDGIEAVEIFKNNIDEIDLVLLDVIMPRSDGRECFQNLRKINPDIKVIFASGFSRDSEEDLFHEYEISGFLRKPYKLSQLSNLCTEALTSVEQVSPSVA